jgi:hypothetical protein
LKRWKKKIRGSISIFVALMMVPTIAFTGLMVDFARINMANAQIQGTAYLAASSAIAYFDGLLLDVYGLMATSQDRKNINDFAQSLAETSLGIDSDGNRLFNSFNLFGNGTVNVTMGPADAQQYTLSNLAYTRAQINNFMKYRFAFSFLDMADALVQLGIDLAEAGDFQSLNPDLARNEINFMSDTFADIGDALTDLHEIYEEIIDRLNDLDASEASFTQQADSLRASINSNHSSLQSELSREEPNQSTIDSLRQSIASDTTALTTHLQSRKSEFTEISNAAARAETKGAEVRTTINNAIQRLEDGRNTRYSDVFVTEAQGDLREFLNGNAAEGVSPSILPVNLSSTGSAFANTNNGRIDTALSAVSAGPVIGAFNLILTPFEAGRRNGLEAALSGDGAADEGEVRGSLRDMGVNLGSRRPRAADAPSPDGSGTDRDEASGAPNLSGVSVPAEYMNNMNNRNATGVSDVNIIEGVANYVLDRLLVTEYGVQMFSNYLTNRTVTSNADQPFAQRTEEKTITGVPFDLRMNFLYGGELEFIYWGNANAQTNFDAVITTLSLYFAARNLVYTFQCPDIRKDIRMIRKIPKIGFILAEVYRITIVATETALDINTLLSGRTVPILKNPRAVPTQWRTGISHQLHLMRPNAWGTIGLHFIPGVGNINAEAGKGTGWYYYEYLRMLILINAALPGGLDRITNRTATLIEMNMNHHLRLQGNSQAFRLSNSYVLATATLDGVVPHYFIGNPFLDGPRGSRFVVSATRGY